MLDIYEKKKMCSVEFLCQIRSLVPLVLKNGSFQGSLPKVMPNPYRLYKME